MGFGRFWAACCLSGVLGDDNPTMPGPSTTTTTTTTTGAAHTPGPSQTPGRQTWFLIDGPRVVCRPGSDSAADEKYELVPSGFGPVEFAVPVPKAKDSYRPHIISVYRTSDAAVNLKLKVEDSEGKKALDETEFKLVEQKKSVVPAFVRRMFEDSDSAADTLIERELDVAQEKATDDVAAEIVEGRQYMPHTAGMDVGAKRSRRPASPPARPPPSRRRTAPPSRRRAAPPSRRRAAPPSRRRAAPPSRRRAAPPSRRRAQPLPPPPGRNPQNPNFVGARRRAAPPGMAPSRPTQYQGYDNNRFHNPQNPGAGAYGYSRPPFNNPQQQPYGYSGHNAYNPSAMGPGSMILGTAVGAGLGTMAGKVAGKWIGSRYLSYGRGHDKTDPSKDVDWGTKTCSWEGQTGSCADCYKAMNDKDKCKVEYLVPTTANRDDLMGTGFIPADYKEPIKISVLEITGEDFTKDKVCPPKGWTPENKLHGWAPPDNDIYLCLTVVKELSDKKDPPATPPPKSAKNKIHWGWIVLIICLACCCCGGLCFLAYKAMNRNGNDDMAQGGMEMQQGGYPGDFGGGPPPGYGGYGGPPPYGGGYGDPPPPHGGGYGGPPPQPGYGGGYPGAQAPYCQNGHPMSHYTQSGPGSASCDRCHRPINPGDTAMGCRMCDYDLCQWCGGGGM